MSRQTALLVSDDNAQRYEYIAVNDTYVYCTYSDDSSYRLVRFNYDGTNKVAVYLDSADHFTVSSCRGIALYSTNVYVVGGNAIHRCDANESHYGIGGAWSNDGYVTATYKWVSSHSNGRGLAISDNGRYLYMTHQTEGTGVITCVDTNTDIITYIDLTIGIGANGIIYHDEHLFTTPGETDVVYDVVLDTPPTSDISSSRIGTDTSPYMIQYDSIYDRFYVSRQGNNIAAYAPTYDASGALSSLTQYDGDYGNVVDASYSTYGFAGHNKVYPDSMTYYDIFFCSTTDGEMALYKNYIVSEMGGDPQIRTLSGKIYTVPDYMKRFNYLKYTDNEGTFSIDCTTRMLSNSDFPQGMMDHDGQNYVSLGSFHIETCPHTYMDKLCIIYGDSNLSIDMDTLQATPSPIVVKATAPHGMPRTSRPGYYPLLDTTQYLEIRHQGIKLQIWSDISVLDRHCIITSVTPYEGAILTGAVTEMPTSKFIPCNRAEIAHTNTHTESFSIKINGVDMKYSMQEEDKHNLVNYLKYIELVTVE